MDHGTAKKNIDAPAPSGASGPCDRTALTGLTTNRCETEFSFVVKPVRAVFPKERSHIGSMAQMRPFHLILIRNQSDIHIANGGWTS